jgi:hypothetical protein
MPFEKLDMDPPPRRIARLRADAADPGVGDPPDDRRYRSSALPRSRVSDASTAAIDTAPIPRAIHVRASGKSASHAETARNRLLACTNGGKQKFRQVAIRWRMPPADRPCARGFAILHRWTAGTCRGTSNCAPPGLTASAPIV